MQYALTLLALAGAAVAQGVTARITAPGSAPAGCSPNYAGTFEVTVVTPPSTKRSLQQRAAALVVSLSNGVLTDNLGRTGYIASNEQFQFDKPPQAGAIYTAGWSVCANGSLALGNEVIFYQCLSGNFYNLYDENISAQCNPIEIQIIPESVSTTGIASVATSAATSVPMSVATSAATSAAMSTATSIATVTTGVTVPASSVEVATTAATSVQAVSQITDGQIQATTAYAPITQISDGQIQATVAASAPAMTTSYIVVSQISDGQIQATTAVSPIMAASSTSVYVPEYTGAANNMAVGGGMLAAVAGAAALLL